MTHFEAPAEQSQSNRSYREELLHQLTELDNLAETQGATKVREGITTVLADFDHPAGKDNARIAIYEFRCALGLESSTPPPKPMFGPGNYSEHFSQGFAAE